MVIPVMKIIEDNLTVNFLYLPSVVTEPEIVSKIPEDIGGKKFYKIPTTKNQWIKVTSVRSWYKISNSSRKGLNGKGKLEYCKGSFSCHSEDCPLLKTNEKYQPKQESMELC